jgi:hypothetical protein
MTGSIINNCTNIYKTNNNNGGLITFAGNSNSRLFINNTAFRSITHNSPGGVAYISGNLDSVG